MSTAYLAQWLLILSATAPAAAEGVKGETVVLWPEGAGAVGKEEGDVSALTVCLAPR